MRHHRFIHVIAIFALLSMCVPARAAETQQVRPFFIDQIKLNKVKTRVPAKKMIKVALIDTGVDSTHPDLTEMLIEGKNMLKPGMIPQDDNGHGTNVAGIVMEIVSKRITDVGNNAVKIMPIKALGSDGFGDEDVMGDAILYAVKNKANIILMSLGLYDYSRYLADVITYAKSQNVLMIAASGNEGEDVMYPAAFPEVVAVGGVDEDNQIVGRSNYGGQLDLVAPWSVYTTQLNGGYTLNQGSSMAAPQVAAIAALFWSAHPETNAEDVRKQLIQNTEDLADRGWDAQTGYGMLRADKVLTNITTKDGYEPNDVLSFAQRIPFEKPIFARLDRLFDRDWYKLLIKEKGLLNVSLKTKSNLRWYFVSPSKKWGPYQGSATILIPITPKEMRFSIQAEEMKSSSTLFKPMEYELNASFQVTADNFEPNGEPEKAYTLPLKTQQINGNFHEASDRDWFEIKAEKEGLLTIQAHPFSARSDIVILYKRKEDKANTLDSGAAGEDEVSPPIWLSPGVYLINVENVLKNTPTTGYQLTITWTEKRRES